MSEDQNLAMSEDQNVELQPDSQDRHLPQTPSRALRREESRRREALADLRLSDLEAQAIAQMASARERRPLRQPLLGIDDEKELREAKRRIEQEEEARREEALQSFKAVLLNREIDAYLKGVDTVTDRASVRAYNIRSIVLLLVVLAVVSMPIIAILLKLSPQDFGTYIAPVSAHTSALHPAGRTVTKPWS